MAGYANGSGCDTNMVPDFCAATIIRNISCGCIFCKLHSNSSYSTIEIEDRLNLSGSGRDQRRVIVSKYGTESFIFLRFEDLLDSLPV